MLTINLNLISLQIKEIVLNHLPIKHIWNLLCILHNFIKKIIISSLSLSKLVLLQIGCWVFQVRCLVDKVLWLSWSWKKLNRLVLLLSCSTTSEIVGGGVEDQVLLTTDGSICSNVKS